MFYNVKRSWEWGGAQSVAGLLHEHLSVSLRIQVWWRSHVIAVLLTRDRGAGRQRQVDLWEPLNSQPTN